MLDTRRDTVNRAAFATNIEANRAVFEGLARQNHRSGSVFNIEPINDGITVGHHAWLTNGWLVNQFVEKIRPRAARHSERLAEAIDNGKSHARTIQASTSPIMTTQLLVHRLTRP